MTTDHMEEATKVLVDAVTNPEAKAIDLVGRLMSANFQDYANTTGMLIENYRRQISDLEAELGAIRHKINELFSGDYMPTETAIAKAVFYPAKSLIEQLRKHPDEDF